MENETILEAVIETEATIEANATEVESILETEEANETETESILETEATIEAETEITAETELVSSFEKQSEELDTGREESISSLSSSNEINVSDFSNLETLIAEQSELIQYQNELIEKQYAVTSTYLNLLTGTLLIIWIIHSIKGSTKKITRHK